MKIDQLFKKSNVANILKTILLAILITFTAGCEKDNYLDNDYADSEYLELEKLKSKYKLKAINYDNVIKFNSIDDAKVFIDKLNDKNKESHKISFKSSTPKKTSASETNSFTVSYKRKANKYKGVRLKSGAVEDDAWYTSTGAANFSSFNLNFNTSDPNRTIDSNSIKMHTSGVRIGWAYTQNTVVMVDNNSFIIKGTVSWGIGVGNATLGYDQNFDLQIDIDWNTNTATWTEL